MAIKTLVPYPSTYLCEVGFSTMTYLKRKCRNALNIYAPLRVALSSIEPQLDKLIEKKQAHTLHYSRGGQLFSLAGRTVVTEAS